MSGHTLKLSFVALLFAILFLAAQFHPCADLATDNTGSHICPVCSAAATVVAAEAPVIAFVSTETAFVAQAAPRVVSTHIPYAASPRASPAV